MAQDDLSRGMYVQSGTDQGKARRQRREPDAGEVAVALELAEAGDRVGILHVVPAYADPVVEPLQGKLWVFGGFEFNDGEAAIRGDGQQVEHAAIGGGEGGDLRVDVRGIELFVEDAEIAVERGLEPALGLQAVERIALVGLCEAALAEARDQGS